MPCDSRYMEPAGLEKDLSLVACCLDELDGKPDPMRHKDGSHPRIYNKVSREQDGDEMVAELCRRCQQIDVTKQSLELQMWWRDHQKADRKRVAEELQLAKEDADRQAALAKLTPYECRLLGLEDD